MTAAQLIPLIISISIFLLVLALGLDAERKDALYLFHRPLLLFRSIASMNVVMVIIAAAIALLVDMARPVEIALVALAISPVPPILPGKQRKAGGSERYAIGLLVAASLFSVLLAPLGVSLVGLLFGLHLGAPPTRIAFIVLITVLAPLVTGIAVKRFLPELAARVKRPTALVAMVLLVLACLPVLFTTWPVVWGLVGNGVALVLIAFTLIGLLVGHSLGGPVAGDRTALALATGTRHPGVAIAIISLNFPDEKAALAVVLYHLVVGTLVSIPYVRWRRKTARSTLG
ncbi:Na+-dependent transporter [Starkeya sp. ORNL1]|uniref:bile acid:sodium symporter family protein n=1 Tax=Starkeya sp. ORNL1 TaxID=2709380 RepID=UPI001463A19C|nr:Na+-dependent transporter [Starkeya sp. ORNL1]QJP12644.1 Na+-dependent transporter [Starkeya sp. ORNL1]